MEISLKLSAPLELGKQSHDELVLKPTPRHMRGAKLVTKADGGLEYEPYALALIGLDMAGIPGKDATLNRLSIGDMNALAQLVMGFFAHSNPNPDQSQSRPDGSEQ